MTKSVSMEISEWAWRACPTLSRNLALNAYSVIFVRCCDGHKLLNKVGLCLRCLLGYLSQQILIFKIETSNTCFYS